MEASEIVKRYLVHPCAHPYITKNGDVVGCGSCPYCLSVRRQQWSFRLEQERKNPLTLFTFGVTGTYDENHVPTLWYCPPCEEMAISRPYTVIGHIQKPLNVTNYQIKLIKGKYYYRKVYKMKGVKPFMVPMYARNLCNSVPSNLVEMEVVEVPEDPESWELRFDENGKPYVDFIPPMEYNVAIFLECERVRVLDYEIIKRYKNNFQKWLQSRGFDLHYYIANEYGGITQRPHFHAIFYITYNNTNTKYISNPLAYLLNKKEIVQKALDFWSPDRINAKHRVKYGDIKYHRIDSGKFGMYLGKYLCKMDVSNYYVGVLLRSEMPMMSKHNHTIGQSYVDKHFDTYKLQLLEAIENNVPVNLTYTENGYVKPLPKGLKNYFFKRLDGFTEVQIRALRYRSGIDGEIKSQPAPLKSLHMFFHRKANYDDSFRIIPIAPQCKIFFNSLKKSCIITNNYESTLHDWVTVNYNNSMYDIETDTALSLLTSSYRYLNSLNKFTPPPLEITNLTAAEIIAIQKHETIDNSPYSVISAYSRKLRRNEEIKRHAEDVKRLRSEKRILKMEKHKQHYYRLCLES